MKVPNNIFSLPDVYPEKIDLPNKKLHCCNMNLECYRETPFLDHRIVRPDDKTYVLDINKLLSIENKCTAGITHYVFHNAFCCSTLFSRCLNTHKSALVLREPNVLLEQASIHRYSGTKLLPNINSSFVDSLSLMLSKLLARRYPDNDVTFIKPTDACNNIMGQLLDVNSSNKCLLMYSDLERFLTAIFKVPQRADWIKVRVNELCIDEVKQHGKLRVNPQTLGNHQLAALVWVLHMEKFRNLIELYGHTKIQVLNSEAFMKKPLESVLKYFIFSNLSVDESKLKSNIGKIMQTHSKENQLNYSYEQREKDYQITHKNYANDISTAVEWANNVFGEKFTCGLSESSS